jgi:glycogen operon protein
LKNPLLPGTPYPLGATFDGRGINFALYSAHAEWVDLCLFDATGTHETSRHRLAHSTDGIWHCYLTGSKPGVIYGYRIHGPYEPWNGHRFNANKVLLDPYALSVVGNFQNDPRNFDFNPEAPHLADSTDNAPIALKAQVVSETFDWSGDKYPATAWAGSVIYEVHVKGFTQLHPDVPKELRGTYAGLAHPLIIAHLKKLGITAIELLPVQYFLDEPRLMENRLVNYWGYNPVAWFTPAPRYASGRNGITPLAEFKAMVKSFHEAGIEVILDVVFNHTAELDTSGPTLSLRGIDNATYYSLEAKGEYSNCTGCGNALNMGHPRAVQLVMDCLRYWASECHVDGFRFDLAVTLGRLHGEFSPAAPLWMAIQQDPLLARCKFIAEPWDIGYGGYQVGRFPTGWSEWNDKFRDSMRRFWLGEGVNRATFAQFFAASSNLFHTTQRLPATSINFITAHDGFTLNDLVSYDHKHNLANKEHNRDGHSHNLGWNCGVEGYSGDPHVALLRLRVRKALLATLLLSQGTPMLLAGDERGHTQQGNNNAYCQDNAITWLNWDESAGNLTDFVEKLLAIRKQIPALQNNRWWKGKSESEKFADVEWLNPSGAHLEVHDWEDQSGKAMMIRLSGNWLLLLNASAHQVHFRLPADDWSIQLSTEEITTHPVSGEFISASRSVVVMLNKAS